MTEALALMAGTLWHHTAQGSERQGACGKDHNWQLDIVYEASETSNLFDLKPHMAEVKETAEQVSGLHTVLYNLAAGGLTPQLFAAVHDDHHDRRKSWLVGAPPS